VQELDALKSAHPIIGDVRGVGMFSGFELVKDPLTKIPAPEQASHIINRMVSQGILLSTDGPDHNVIKIKPPLVFQRDHADQFLDRLENILKENAFQI
jgi:4-aminobutyrate aminotransferase-like enzyme